VVADDAESQQPFSTAFAQATKKTVETVVRKKTRCNHRAEATVLMRFFAHQTASLRYSCGAVAL
jgi:hypothetical protein